MSSMEQVLTIILFVFGILQIILFFKVWGMTNDVKRIANPKDEEEDRLIKNAQLYELDGNKEMAFEWYKRAFVMSVLELYKLTSSDEVIDKTEYWQEHYSGIVRYYDKRIAKTEIALNFGDYDSYEKVQILV